MQKSWHEIRDPIHVFIRLDSDERRVLDTRPVQRLRKIHQLAMSYLVYPGATHKRFEHSLGVMELAGRVFDVVTDPNHVTDSIRRLVPETVQGSDQLGYWRRVLRMAALCHDLGHLPFSHAAEEQLLPAGVTHEVITEGLIRSPEMQEVWNHLIPPLNTDHIVKLAVGPAKAKDLAFSNWEALLSEIIVGDAFGVDRMDYLLRDSYHAGVAYGRFDHFRLIDTLRILEKPTAEEIGNGEPALGVEEGEPESAEALLLARYFMFSQVYFHSVRRAYDFHLIDFLKDWLPNGKFPSEPNEILNYTDVEVTAAMLAAARETASAAHESSLRIVGRRHFRVGYSRNPDDMTKNPEPGKAVYESIIENFGEGTARHDFYTQRGSVFDFPVLERDGRVASSASKSETLQKVPLVLVDRVYVDPDRRADVEAFVKGNLNTILTASTPQEEGQ